MPKEFSRTTTVKRFTPPVNPGDKPDKSDTARHVDMPVIKAILFRDPKTKSQGYNFRFDNSSGSADDNTDKTTRKVHTHNVINARLDTDGTTVIYASTSVDGKPPDTPLSAGDNALSVERIEKYHARDAKSLSQESVYRVYRNDPDPPPTTISDLVVTSEKTGLTQKVWVDGDGKTFTQLKSHVVRYFMNNDYTQQVWIDSELTDMFEFRDAKEGPGQGRIFTLNNDSTGDGKPGKPGKFVSDPSLPNPDTTDPYNPTIAVFDGSPPDNLGDTSKVVDPSWRTDPFQNIVNVSWLAGIFVFFENSGPVFPARIVEDFDEPGTFQMPTGRVNRIHTSKDGKTWTTMEMPGDAWAAFPPYIAGNGAWMFGYNVSAGWIYVRDGGGGGTGPWTYFNGGLVSGTSTLVLSVDGFNWSDEVGSADAFDPYFAMDGTFVQTNDPPIRNLSFPSPALNAFQYQKIVTPIVHGGSIYDNVSVPIPLPPNTVPNTLSVPYPGKITNVTTQDPILNDGLHPGFWYSEDRGVTWVHTIALPPTTPDFQADVLLSFGPPGKMT